MPRRRSNKRKVRLSRRRRQSKRKKRSKSKRKKHRSKLKGGRNITRRPIGYFANPQEYYSIEATYLKNQKRKFITESALINNHISSLMKSDFDFADLSDVGMKIGYMQGEYNQLIKDRNRQIRLGNPLILPNINELKLVLTRLHERHRKMNQKYYFG